MLRFFPKWNSDKNESNDLRLRVVEWKLNLILAIVGIQLTLTTLMLVKQILLPSTTTMVLCGVAMVVAMWVFRKQIPGLIKRLLIRQAVSDKPTAEKPATEKSPRREMEDSIR